MKKMKIEKQLIFADHVNRIVSLQVQENLAYRHEEDGIRAMGPLMIKGQYEGENGIEKFQETLEMDVLAPQTKLSNDPFYLEIGEYAGDIKDDSIVVNVTMNIHGLLEDGCTKQAQKPIVPLSAMEAPVQETMPSPTVLRKQEVPVQEEIVYKQAAQPQASVFVEAEHISEPAVENQEEPVNRPVDDFEDLFANEESTYTSYRIIVAKPNDTYTAIASRYDVDETSLRDTNKNKEILPKTLVILPFDQK